MEKFTPYQQALDLKELGFNEPCFAYQIKYQKPIIQIKVKNSKLEKQALIYRNTYKGILPIKITLPTFSQAFRWLLALVNKDKHFNNKWTISYNEDYYSLFLGGCNMGVFEAELECLKKLIEIVKEK